MTIRPGDFQWRPIVIGLAALVTIAGCQRAPQAEQAPAEGLDASNGVVEGPVTYVAARVADVVLDVLVENDQRVEQGAVLVRLDPAPLQTAIDAEQAELQVAEAQLEQTRADVRAQAATAMADWFSIIKERNLLRQNVAQLRSDVAGLKLRQAEFTLAESQYQRAVQLAKQRVITADEMEQRQASMQVAQQQVNQAEARVQQARASVGLEPAGDGAAVPPDLEQKFASIRLSLFTWAQSLAKIGFPIKLDQLEPDIEYGQTPGLKSAPEFQRKLDSWIDTSPAMRLAQAKVSQARSRLRAAEHALAYAQIVAPVAGLVENRTVDPGESVEVGHTLLTIRSLERVWVEARFPQSDLERLRIGQPATIRTAAYPGHTFRGRVSGLRAMTNESGSMVQPPMASAEAGHRLPVRIELSEPNTETPLLVGLPVSVEVDWHAEPAGPDAGGRLPSSAAKPPRKSTTAEK
ncbi:MAG TPA: efflux RND transporter periplasmic adaptor subunit [Pirellulales bacterium]|jgi:membrane fusion protein (multidrug efflux system)|nr:efflux RND transporter periplasmic adaptor subunit [Pirellulales bacterium]